MTLLLTILKFGGILVSGALGILGTVTETRNKKTGKLTAWGKCALWLTVAGFAVALGAQLFETIKSAQEDTEKKEQAARQLVQANKMLTAISIQSTQSSAVLNSVQQQGVNIERIITRIDRVSMDVLFELPTTESPGSNFLSTLRRRIKPDSDDPDFGPLLNFKFYQNQITNTGFFSQTERLLMMSLPEPFVQIGLNREPKEPKSPDFVEQQKQYDFCIMDWRTNAVPVLGYYPNLGRIFVEYDDWELPIEMWTGNGKITSLTDLDHAQLLIRIGDVSDKLRNMRVNQIVLHINRHSISPASLKCYQVRSNVLVCEVFLPSAKEIFAAPSTKSNYTRSRGFPRLSPRLDLNSAHSP